MREVIRTYQNAVAGEITRFEGYVAKFMGDGVLAYFGWPRAHEDDAERAVRAGLAIAAAVAELAAPTGEPLAARVGIATGLVVVGDLIGEGAAQEEAVVGDTPNLAARLQALAAPGQVVIADVTRRLLGAGFELEDLGARALKGISRAGPGVRGHRRAAGREPVRGDERPVGAALVGRDQELALLRERWAQAKAGEGQGVLLVGEAGIGKSRISRALLDALADEPHTRDPLPVLALPRRQRALAGDPAADPCGRDRGRRPDRGQAGQARGAAWPGERHADGRAPDRRSASALDGEARYGPLDLTPQMQRARTLEALVDQLLGLARQQPVLMVARGRPLDRSDHARADRAVPRPDRRAPRPAPADQPPRPSARARRAPACHPADPQSPRPRGGRGDRWRLERWPRWRRT